MSQQDDKHSNQQSTHQSNRSSLYESIQVESPRDSQYVQRFFQQENRPELQHQFSPDFGFPGQEGYLPSNEQNAPSNSSLQTSDRKPNFEIIPGLDLKNQRDNQYLIEENTRPNNLAAEVRQSITKNGQITALNQNEGQSAETALRDAKNQKEVDQSKKSTYLPSSFGLTQSTPGSSSQDQNPLRHFMSEVLQQNSQQQELMQQIEPLIQNSLKNQGAQSQVNQILDALQKSHLQQRKDIIELQTLLAEKQQNDNNSSNIVSEQKTANKQSVSSNSEKFKIELEMNAAIKQEASTYFGSTSDFINALDSDKIKIVTFIKSILSKNQTQQTINSKIGAKDDKKQDQQFLKQLNLVTASKAPGNENKDQKRMTRKGSDPMFDNEELLQRMEDQLIAQLEMQFGSGASQNTEQTESNPSSQQIQQPPLKSVTTQKQQMDAPKIIQGSQLGVVPVNSFQENKNAIKQAIMESLSKSKQQVVKPITANNKSKRKASEDRYDKKEYQLRVEQQLLQMIKNQFPVDSSDEESGEIEGNIGKEMQKPQSFGYESKEIQQKQLIDNKNVSPQNPSSERSLGNDEENANKKGKQSYLVQQLTIDMSKEHTLNQQEEDVMKLLNSLQNLVNDTDSVQEKKLLKKADTQNKGEAIEMKQNKAGKGLQIETPDDQLVNATSTDVYQIENHMLQDSREVLEDPNDPSNLFEIDNSYQLSSQPYLNDNDDGLIGLEATNSIETPAFGKKRMPSLSFKEKDPKQQQSSAINQNSDNGGRVKKSSTLVMSKDGDKQQQQDPETKQKNQVKSQYNQTFTYDNWKKEVNKIFSKSPRQQTASQKGGSSSLVAQSNMSPKQSAAATRKSPSNLNGTRSRNQKLDVSMSTGQVIAGKGEKLLKTQNSQTAIGGEYQYVPSSVRGRGNQSPSSKDAFSKIKPKISTFRSKEELKKSQGQNLNSQPSQQYQQQPALNSSKSSKLLKSNKIISQQVASNDHIIGRPNNSMIDLVGAGGINNQQTISKDTIANLEAAKALLEGSQQVQSSSSNRIINSQNSQRQPNTISNTGGSRNQGPSKSPSLK